LRDRAQLAEDSNITMAANADGRRFATGVARSAFGLASARNAAHKTLDSFLEGSRI
jgi:hypothetical protein